MIIDIKNNSGGALLFAIITSFVIAFTSVTLTAIIFNQARMTIREEQRIQSINRLKSGMLYTHNLISKWVSREVEPPRQFPYSINWQDMTIRIEQDRDRISIYKVNISMRY